MTVFLTSGIFWLYALFFIIALYSATYYLIYYRQTKRWKQSNIPFLPPTPLVGHKYFANTKQSVTIPIDKIYNENKDKDLIGFFLGPTPVILLKEPKLISQVMVKNFSRTFASGFAMPESEVEAQFSILPASNQKIWKTARNILLPVFSHTWFEGARFDRVKETIQEICQTVENSKGHSLAVKKLIGHGILNITSSSFGIEGNSQAVQELGTITDTHYAPTFHRVLSFYSLLYFPFLQMISYFKVLSSKNINIMSRILQQQINQRDQMNIEKDDLIDILRSIRDEQQSYSYNRWDKESDVLPLNKKITMREMTGLSLTLVLGGVDTVSNLLNFAVHLLSLYPEFQRKIKIEAQQIMKQHGVSEFNFQVVQDLSLTFQCLYEASRLYPLVGIIMKRCSEDFQIPGSNYSFKEGDRVIAALYSGGRDERYFPNPHKFDPERFKAEKMNSIPSGAFLSFGIGPRKCPGYKQGLTVAAAILASILYKFEIKPSSHLKQIDPTDFHPLSVVHCPKKEIIVNIIPHNNVDDVSELSD